MKKNIALIFLTGLVISCSKKTEIKGIVYSKHNIPVPNVGINYEQYGESDYPESTYRNITTTDARGAYSFSFRGKKRYSYHVTCVVDSGSQNITLNSIGGTNNIDLHLK